MSSIAHMEHRERVDGRYAQLLGQAEDIASRHNRQGSTETATMLRVLVDIIARQEIELRQAIADKCARPVVERR